MEHEHLMDLLSLIYTFGSLLFIIYILRMNRKARLPKETTIKFQQICKMEDRSTIDQQKRIIKEFIKTYENTHNLRWDENNQRYE